MAVTFLENLSHQWGNKEANCITPEEKKKKKRANIALENRTENRSLGGKRAKAHKTKS